MKIRRGFVSNSSSCSFIIDTRELDESKLETFLELVEKYCAEATVAEMHQMYSECDFDAGLYLVEHTKGEHYYHIWATRDEYLEDNVGEELADILFQNDCGEVPPKFDEHY